MIKVEIEPAAFFVDTRAGVHDHQLAYDLTCFVRHKYCNGLDEISKAQLQQFLVVREAIEYVYNFS